MNAQNMFEGQGYSVSENDIAFVCSLLTTDGQYFIRFLKEKEIFEKFRLSDGWLQTVPLTTGEIIACAKLYGEIKNNV